MDNKNKKQQIKKIHTTHEAFQFMIILAQCFATIPVNGINGHTYRSLNFRWKCFKFIYSALYLCLLFVDIIILIWHTAGPKFKLGNFGNTF